ncbi:MAG: hypothetical protein ABSC19_10250 [Syntrophorhabdales bacterium]|jgi:hypothetical protein
MMKKGSALFLVVVCGLGVWMIASAGITSQGPQSASRWTTLGRMIASSAGITSQSTSSSSYVAAGKGYLYDHDNADFKNAVTAFQQAVTAGPTDQEAQFYYAVTQVAWVYQNPSAAATGTLTSVKQALQLSGLSFTTFGLYDTESPTGPAGLASTTPTTGAACTFLKNALLPKIQTALTSLNKVTDSFSSTLEPSALNRTGANLTVDYGDVLVIEAGLQATEGMLDFLLAYNLNVNPIPLVNTKADSRTTFRHAVQQNSALMTPADPTLLADAKTAIDSSITTFNTAVQTIQNRAVAGGHLFVLDVPITNGVADATTSSITNLQALLADIQASLAGPRVFSSITSGQAAGQAFDGSKLFNSSSPLNIRSLITDANGNFAQTDPTLGGIAPTGGLSFFKGTISMTPGWNLVSLPAIPAKLTIADVLAPLGSTCPGLWGYDAASQEYQGYLAGSSNNSLTSFEAGQGYWVYMFAPAALSLKGGSAPATVKLNPGWNLVGYGGSSCVAASSALSSIAGTLQVSWGYSNQSWKVYDPNDPAGSTLTQLCPNNAYWVKVDQAKTWTVPTN